MTTEQSPSESTPQKRQRRIKQDPEYIFENSTTDELPSTSINKSNKLKSVYSVDENTNDIDLYKPGDIVWSKLGSFPWWPALIYRCDAEDGIYKRTLNKLNNKSKQQYFVYFYGKYLEYAWLSTRSLLKYAGLNDFIQNAEQAVQQALTKSEQIELANRYQLKVSMKKRVQWDEAIALADRALKLTNDERIQEFHDLLNGVQNKKQRSKNGIRRKHSESSILLQSDEQPIKKKRGRKPKSESKINEIKISNTNHSEHEIEYEYLPTNLPLSFSSIPSLSNFELKQIVEGLINHPEDKTLTFDQAQSFAIKKATEIVYENHNYQMNDVSSEWFYDSILLKYPSVVFKYRSWFENINPKIIPDENDLIKLKQWQIVLMIEAQIQFEQSSNDNLFL